MNSGVKFSHVSFLNRLKSSLKVDVRRAFISKFNYIMIAVAFIIPILMLVMTTMNSSDGSAMFSSSWQLIGLSVAGVMDLASMCNINMIYFFFIVVACLFVGDEYKSGYVENIFTLRAKKSDYIVSKILVLSIIGSLMLLAYFIGTVIGGGIAGLSLAMSGFNGFNLVMCLLSKFFLTIFFSAITVLVASIGKERMWISIVGVLGFNMLFFNVIPLITPLTATLLHPILVLVFGGLMAALFGYLANIILKKTNLV